MEKIKVLMVDDDEDFAETISDRYDGHALHTKAVFNDTPAIEFVSNQIPDVIILDLEMTGLSGLEIIRHVKQTSPEVQVIVLNGHMSGADRMAAYFYGAYAFLKKPVSTNHLLEEITAAYRNRPPRKPTGSHILPFIHENRYC